MKSEDIKINDWQRIFIGDVPIDFYPEVIIRIAIIYLVLMVSMRLMGKRMASQLSRNEMIGMVSLAAAIGVPLQSSDRGILAIVVIAAIVISIQQLVARLSSRNEKTETLTQGNITMLIEDGCLKLHEMKKAGITRERAFSQLRGDSLNHLGEVKRLYFEAAGTFTLIKNDNIVPGLPILPIWDKEYQAELSEVCDDLVCEECGKVSKEKHEGRRCENCNHSKFIQAVK
ncbi:DUF421 domain-containing protein [Dyadobacter sp. CY345]|uniref:DUF421 domain-containing protein n=1 Tax=Dyadobacter sp. CY345 TaxID=2909335 RepID=UPI001F3D6B42|nr:YetF domain-containing protein [Dyadobacter sp. CY345]MCF2446695.1 DUF421 domain-containing protein [Dyadobacter sp. CY345]